MYTGKNSGAVILWSTYGSPPSNVGTGDKRVPRWEVFSGGGSQVFAWDSPPSTATGAYTLDAQPAAFTFTGANATLQRGFLMDAAAGAFSLAGANIETPRTYVLDAGFGSYALAGGNATLAYSGGTGEQPSTAGAGYPVDWQGKRRKLKLKERPRAHLDAILEKVVADYRAAKVPPAVIERATAEAKAVLEEMEVEVAEDNEVEADLQSIQQESSVVRGIMRRARMARLQRDDAEILVILH